MRYVLDHDRRECLYQQRILGLFRIKIQDKIHVLISTLLFLLFLFPSLCHAVGSVGVRPLRIDLELSADKKGEFEIEVYSTSKEDTPVHLSLFDARQKENGMLEFVNVGEDPYSCTQWIKFERQDFTVSAGESVFVKGEILVPRTKAGSRVATIMVEPGYEKKKTGFSVKLRYAVVLRLRVTGGPVLEEAKVEKFGIKKLSDGTPVIEAVLLNKSETEIQAKGGVLVQDNSGKIITRVNLTTEALERRKQQDEEEDDKKEKIKSKKSVRDTEEEEGQRIFPGAKVAFMGRFDKPLAPGDYTAILTMKYNRRSITRKENITLTQEDLASLSEKPVEASSFEIKPASIEVKGQPGGVRTVFFTISNLSDKPARLTLSVKDIAYDTDGRYISKDQGTTPYSASGWIHLDKSECEIGPRLSQSVSLKCEIPASAQPGGWYSQMVIEKCGSGTGRNEKNFMEIGVIIPGEVEPAVNITSFERSKEEGSKDLIVNIKNDSAMHVIPKGRVIINDVYHNKVEQVELTLNARTILPQSEGRMTGGLGKKLIPGEYTAKAEIEYGGKERATAKTNFVIK